MSTEDQLKRARTLIEDKRYGEARVLLTSINHPTAKKWLAKLDGITTASVAPTTQKPARAGGSPVLAILLLIIGLAVGGIAGFVLAPKNSAAAAPSGAPAVTQTPNVVLMEPVFCDYAAWDEERTSIVDDFTTAAQNTNQSGMQRAIDALEAVAVPECEVIQTAHDYFIDGMNQVLDGSRSFDTDLIYQGYGKMQGATGILLGYVSAKGDALVSMRDQLIAAGTNTPQ